MKDPSKRTRCAIPLFLFTLGAFPILCSAGNPSRLPRRRRSNLSRWSHPARTETARFRWPGSRLEQGGRGKTLGDRVLPRRVVSDCNRHLSSIQETQTALIEIGFQVIAISPDDPEHIRKTIAEGQSFFPGSLG